MKKRILIAVLAISFMLVQGAAFAEKKGYHGKDMKNMSTKDKFFKKIGIIYMNKEELAVSDEQLEEIKKLKISLKKDLIRKEADIDLIKVDIKSLMYEDKMDLGAINKLIDQKYDIKKAKSKKIIASCAKLREILSEEQMEEVKKLCMEKHKMHGKK